MANKTRKHHSTLSGESKKIFNIARIGRPKLILRALRDTRIKG
jgi:hypothetical protein